MLLSGAGEAFRPSVYGQAILMITDMVFVRTLTAPMDRSPNVIHLRILPQNVAPQVTKSDPRLR